jgi:hypothetical protein
LRITLLVMPERIRPYPLDDRREKSEVGPSPGMQQELRLMSSK